MAKTRKLTFYLKKVKTNDNNDLQAILNSLKGLTVEERSFRQGEKVYVLNHISEYEGMYYAEIVCFEKDRMQSIIQTRAKANNLNERNITTKDIKEIDENDNTPTEFVQSRIIFGLSGNNLAINTSRVGLQKFLDYINYLLNTYYWKDPDNAKAIIIIDAYTKDLKEKLKTTHVSYVKIGQEVLAERNDKNKYNIKKKSLLHTLSELVDLPKGFSSTLDDANLRTSIVIDYYRNTSTEGQKVLDDITASLSTLDDTFINIVFEDGSEFTGGNIRIKGAINQRHNDDKENSFDRIKMQKDVLAFLQQSLE
ncbi:hypothetical protein A9Z61_00065 [Moraxella osloensis]|nr:hypothetical protein [Moraxella osloensis]OBX57825.1 hypothetical protein A9Z61_00065 [Moraxella osloensis]BAV11139.1 hypothetical protein MOSL_0566 [Moraxella osloensis]